MKKKPKKLITYQVAILNPGEVFGVHSLKLQKPRFFHAQSTDENTIVWKYKIKRHEGEIKYLLNRLDNVFGCYSK